MCSERGDVVDDNKCHFNVIQANHTPVSATCALRISIFENWCNIQYYITFVITMIDVQQQR